MENMHDIAVLYSPSIMALISRHNRKKCTQKSPFYITLARVDLFQHSKVLDFSSERIRKDISSILSLCYRLSYYGVSLYTEFKHP